MFFHLQPNRKNISQIMSKEPVFLSSAVCSPRWAFCISCCWCRGSQRQLQNATREHSHPLSLCHAALTAPPSSGTWNPTAHHTHPTLLRQSTNQPQQPFVPHTVIHRVLNLYLEKVNGITHGEPYNFIISRSFCSLHGFHEGPSALMALG